MSDFRQLLTSINPIFTLSTDSGTDLGFSNMPISTSAVVLLAITAALIDVNWYLPKKRIGAEAAGRE